MFIIPHLCDNFNIHQSIIVSLQSTIDSEEKKKKKHFEQWVHLLQHLSDAMNYLAIALPVNVLATKHIWQFKLY